MINKIRNKMKKDYVTLTILIALSIGCSIGFYQCKKTSNTSSTTPAQGANEVYIQNMAYSPSSIAVSANTTVKWTNKDGVAHTVTSNTGLFDSGNMGTGGTFSHEFTTAGTYLYKCTIHSGMTGTVIVQQ